MNEDFKHFLTCWLAGLFKGLDSVDQTAQDTILQACGKGCAQSYTAQIFRDTRQHSVDLETFLTNLARRFPEATYESIGPRDIRVTYSDCACDLVRLGFTRSPLLCRCSAYNLQANFEQAFQTPVDVTIQSSILRQEKNCTFVVTFRDEIESIG